MAHEIRNPLTAIKGFVQLLEKELDKPIYFDILSSEISRIGDIVDALITLAKPQVPAIQSVDPRTLLQQLVLLAGMQSILYNVEILLDIDNDLPTIFCDENQITKVFLYFLQNAVLVLSTKEQL